jgi:predicted N-acetyltransferase YhbS
MPYRLATAADIPALVELRWEFQTEGVAAEGAAYAEFVAECTAFLTRALAGDRWHIWVAEAGSEVVAHIFLQLVEKVPKPGSSRTHMAYMTNVYTRPSRQGQGIGGGLLWEVCRWAEAANLELIIVWPSERSVPFYTRAGFQPVQDALVLSFEDGVERGNTPKE